jgi:hypothetical protein
LVVDWEAVAILKLFLLDQLDQVALLPVDQVDYVEASVADSMVVVDEAASEAAFKIEEATVVAEEAVLATKAVGGSHHEVAMVAVVEIAAVGMAAMHHQMPLLAPAVVGGVALVQVGMDAVVMAHRALRIEMAQHRLLLQHHLEVGMNLVAHMMTDPLAVIVAAAAAAEGMATVAAILAQQVAVATWSR